MHKVALKVNGKDVPLNPQMQGVFFEVVAGLLRTLRGIDGPVSQVSLDLEF